MTVKVNIADLKKLREETLAGVADCRQALEDAAGDMIKARKLITERGLTKAAKKADKATGQGIVESYVHATGKVGVLVTLLCETDFVARNEEFRKLAHEIAMQIAATDPKNIGELLKEPNIRDQSLTVGDLVKQSIAKLGENITVGSFTRLSI